MVKPPGVFPERFVRAVGEGEQAGGCCRRGLGITLVARASGCTYMVEPLLC